MAEGTKLNPSTIVGGDTIDTELVGAVKIPRSKIVIGARDVDGGDVAAGNPLPVAGAVTVAVLPLPTGAAADATLTSGTQKSIARGGAKGTTTAADLTSVAVDGNTQALHASVTNFPATQAISALSLPLPAGAALDATLTGGTAKARITDGTNTAAVKSASTASAATDLALVVALHPSSATPTSRKGTAVNTTIAPTSTAASVLAANAARVRALFVNTGQVTVYLGQSGVTTGNGIPILSGGSFEDDASNSQWYAITASATGALVVCEVA